MLLFSLTVSLVLWWMFLGPEGLAAASGGWMKGPTLGTRRCFVRPFFHSLSVGGQRRWKKSVSSTHTTSIQQSLRSSQLFWLDSAFRVQWQILLWCRSLRSFSLRRVLQGPLRGPREPPQYGKKALTRFGPPEARKHVWTQKCLSCRRGISTNEVKFWQWWWYYGRKFWAVYKRSRRWIYLLMWNLCCCRSAWPDQSSIKLFTFLLLHEITRLKETQRFDDRLGVVWIS